MLPLCAGQFVLGDHLPSVRIVLVHEHTPCSHVNHRLDRESHTGNKQHTRTLVAIVLHIRVLVELAPHSMTAQVTHHAVTVCMGMLGNRITQVTDKDIRLPAHLLTYLQALPRYIHQTLPARISLAYHEHTARIGIVPVQDRRTVDIHDVTLLQHILLLGNTMTHHLVNTRAAAFRISLVIKRCRNTTVSDGKIIHYPVNLQRGHSLTYLPGNSIQNRSIQLTRTADTLYLLLRLYQITAGTQLPTLLELQYTAVHLRRRQPRNQLPIIPDFIFSHLIIYI